MLKLKQVSKFFILGVCASWSSSIIGCGPLYEPVNPQPATTTATSTKDRAGLVVSSSIVGHWVSNTCAEVGHSDFQNAVLDVKADKSFSQTLIHFGDSACSFATFNETRSGTFSTSGMSINLSIRGQGTELQIFSLSGNRLCLGDPQTADASGRPTQLDLQNCYTR